MRGENQITRVQDLTTTVAVIKLVHINLSTYEKLNRDRIALLRIRHCVYWSVGILIALGVFTKVIDWTVEKENRFIEIKIIAGPTYYPNPQPYGKKEVNQEIRDRAGFEVLY